VVVQLQQNKLIQAKFDDAEMIATMIENSITSAMKRGESKEVQAIISELGKNKEIKSLRILSKDGTILKSSNTKEIGTRSKSFLLNGNEKLDKPILKEASLYGYRIIKNREECFGCHDRSEKINGIIEVTIDFTRHQQTLRTLKNTLLSVNIFALLSIALFLGILLSIFVIKPLGKFLKTIKEVEKGNWDARVEVTSQDELGTLGESFNKMVQEIKALYDKNLKKEKELSRIKTELQHKFKLEELTNQLQYKIKEVESANKTIMSLTKEIRTKNVELTNMVERLKKINEVGRILTTIIESRELVKLIAKTSTELLDAEKSAIHLKDEKRTELSIKYTKGLGIEEIDDISVEFKSIYTEVFEKGKPLFLTTYKDSKKTAMAVPLKMRGTVVGAIVVENKKGGLEFTLHELEILSTFANQAMVAIENAWLYEKVKSNYFATIQSLVNALEANDRYTKGHSERVRILATELGKYIGLDYKDLEILEHAAILHDIGKIGIDSMILSKKGKLTAPEYSVVKSHPLIGEEILSPIETLEDVRTTIIQHHERYDGLGYPYGLAGEETSLKARILAVVDTFDAMLTDRPYRKAFPYSKVIDELRAGAGTQFDPFVVESFIEMLQMKGQNYLMEIGYALTLSSSN
jgi:HD-GYP domain-containing protein (c-di-GMP phosphodiesterase class II)